jgi:dTDP-4-amino-4,6-dideoxygalactose transaminase
MKTDTQKLAILGGTPSIKREPPEMFKWPIITREDEEAVLKVLRRGGMSGTDVTMEFENKYAAWQGSRFGLGCSTGTASLQSAMFGLRVGVGDEIIGPSVTYWASVLQVFSLGATVVFADIDPVTLCIDPKDIEHRITKRTKAIVVVHYLGYPADMDPIMKIARRHKIPVLEDVSHAQGGLYRGRKVGAIGEVAGASLMSGKSFAIGEAGILTTDNREIYERAVAFGHYERFGNQIQSRELRPFQGLPMGGYKYRMHQLSSAVGLVQLKYYDQRTKEIRKAMNYFWDLLEGVPGVRAHRPTDPKSHMAGHYAPHGLYVPEELGGLSVTRFCQAVRAEGFGGCVPGVNMPLHLYPLFNKADIYGHGKPTRLAHTTRDLRQGPGSLPVSEEINKRTYSIPWFKHYCPKVIEQYAAAFRKAALQAERLRKDDPGNPPEIGGSHFFAHR